MLRRRRRGPPRWPRPRRRRGGARCPRGASSPEAVAAALAEAEEAPWRRLLPPSVVIRGDGDVVLRSAEEPVVQVRLESGEVVPVEGAVEGERRGELVAWRVQLRDLPLGWHRLE